MSNQSTIHPLSITVGVLLLISLAGARVSSAAGTDADSQAQAAYLLQHPLNRIAITDGFQQSGNGNDKILAPQEQAKRVLQPVAAGGAESSGSGQFLASQSVEPQLQAVRVLTHNPQ